MPDDTERAAARHAGRRGARAPPCATVSSGSCAATRAADRARLRRGRRGRCAPAASSSTSSSPPRGCASWRRWTARSCSTATPPASCGPPCTSCPTRRSPPSESGTRHRTAERVAKQTGYPVISVSQSMRIIALYVDGPRYVLEDSAAILSKANQALADPRALQAPARRGRRHAVGARDRGPRHRPRRRRRRAAAGDGAPHRRGDRGLRRRARHRRPAAVPAARRADRRRRAPTASWSSATTCRRGRRERATSTTCSPSSTRSTDRAARPDRGRPGARLPAAGDALDAAGHPARATACWPRCRGCPAPSSTGWSSTSAACRSCSPPASTTCRRSRASASAGPGRPRGPVPAGRVQRSSSATSDRHDRRWDRPPAHGGSAPGGSRLVRRERPGPALAPPREDARGVCWSARSCSSRRRWSGSCRRGRAGCERWPAPADLAGEAPGGRSVPGSGSATPAARCACTPLAVASSAPRRRRARPRDPDLLALPGVGAYTAAAVASFAFGAGTPSSTPTSAGSSRGSSRARAIPPRP